MIIRQGNDTLQGAAGQQGQVEIVVCYAARQQARQVGAPLGTGGAVVAIPEIGFAAVIRVGKPIGGPGLGGRQLYAIGCGRFPLRDSERATVAAPGIDHLDI